MPLLPFRRKAHRLAGQRLPCAGAASSERHGCGRTASAAQKRVCFQTTPRLAGEPDNQVRGQADARQAGSQGVYLVGEERACRKGGSWRAVPYHRRFAETDADAGRYGGALPSRRSSTSGISTGCTDDRRTRSMPGISATATMHIRQMLRRRCLFPAHTRRHRRP